MTANTNDPAQHPFDLPAGLPVFDCHGEQLGVVSAVGVLEQDLMVTEGHLLHRDVAVPISAIARRDAHGVYLNRTKQDIHDLTLGGWSSLGEVDLNTGVPAGGAAPHEPERPPAPAPGTEGETRQP